MLAALALCAVLGYPDAPLADQVEIGRKIATAGHKFSLGDLFAAPPPRSGFAKVWGDERQTIGWWSNGYSQQPVEYAVWLSPALVSRWLGFLSAREFWTPEEMAARWKTIAAEIKDRRVFIVQLTAFPKLPTLGVGDVERTSPEELDNVRFVYTSGARTERMQAERLAAWQSRDRFDLENFPWWQFVSFGSALTGEFEKQAIEEPLPLGDYYRSWFAVWVDAADEPTFELHTLSLRKDRKASYRVTASK